MTCYILQTCTHDGLPLYYDGAFFTTIRDRAYVFDDDYAEDRRDRAAYIFDRGFEIVDEQQD